MLVKNFVKTLVAIASIMLLLPLEFDNFSARKIIYPIIWVSLLFLLIKMLPKSNSFVKYTVVLPCLVLLVPAFFYVLAFETGFCAWSLSHTLYLNKSDASVKISRRGYGCYMTDDDQVLFKERTLTKHLKWITEFHELPIDTSNWRKVEPDYTEKL